MPAFPGVLGTDAKIIGADNHAGLLRNPPLNLNVLLYMDTVCCTEVHGTCKSENAPHHLFRSVKLL